MKRSYLFLFLVCFMLSGCFFAPAEIEYSHPIEYVDACYENMEIYQFLSGSITEDSSLEEMLDAFSQMSEIPVDSTTDMYLYEVYSYSFEGADYLNCHIVRQVDEPGTDEYIQLHLDITYLYDDDMAGLQEVTWFERDSNGFIHHIQRGELYRILAVKPIYQRHVSISST